MADRIRALQIVGIANPQIGSCRLGVYNRQAVRAATEL